MNRTDIEKSFYEIDNDLSTLFDLLKLDYVIDEQSNLIIFQSETNSLAISGGVLEIQSLKNIIMSSETIRIRLSLLREIIDRLEINSFLIDNETYHNSLINEATDDLVYDVTCERDSLYDKVYDLENDLEKAEEKINNLESEIQDLESQLEESNYEINKLDNLKAQEISDLENQLKTALALIEELESAGE